MFATAGSGSGLSSFALGSRGGVESVALGLNHVPPHAHTVSIANHTHPGAPTGNSVIGGGGGFSSSYGSGGSTGAAGAFSGNETSVSAGAGFSW